MFTSSIISKEALQYDTPVVLILLTANLYRDQRTTIRKFTTPNQFFNVAALPIFCTVKDEYSFENIRMDKHIKLLEKNIGVNIDTIIKAASESREPNSEFSALNKKFKSLQKSKRFKDNPKGLEKEINKLELVADFTFVAMKQSEYELITSYIAEDSGIKPFTNGLITKFMTEMNEHIVRCKKDQDKINDEYKPMSEDEEVKLRKVLSDSGQDFSAAEIDGIMAKVKEEGAEVVNNPLVYPNHTPFIELFYSYGSFKFLEDEELSFEVGKLNKLENNLFMANIPLMPAYCSGHSNMGVKHLAKLMN